MSIASAAGKLSRRLTAQDASFLYAESRNGPTHIGSLLFFELVDAREEPRGRGGGV